MSQQRGDILTPEHPRWDELIAMLTAWCGVREVDGDWIAPKCPSTPAMPMAREVMKTMGDVDIEATLDYCTEHGATCDCEIVLVVK
jgi:hypothetical protein